MERARYFVVLFVIAIIYVGTNVWANQKGPVMPDKPCTTVSKLDKKDLWDGGFYKANSQPQYRGAIAKLDEYHFRGEERVLDIGCGDGKITAEIARRVPKGSVVGIDASLSMIDQALRDHKSISNLSFCHIDALDICFDQEFDLVVSFCALHWIKDQSKLTRNIYNALKPGGNLLVLMLGDSFPYVAEFLRQDRWQKKLTNKEKRYLELTASEYFDILSAGGFTNINTVNKVNIRVLSLDDFTGWFNGVIPSITGLSGDDAREFARELIKYIRADQLRERDIAWDSHMLHAKASKPIK